MPQFPGNDQMLAGMDAMLGGGEGGPDPMGLPPLPPDGGAGATPDVGSEGVGPDVVAALVSENVQLRSLLGLGPDDPVPPLPMGGDEVGAGGMGLPPMEPGPAPF